jgi:hypothetical protein
MVSTWWAGTKDILPDTPDNSVVVLVCLFGYLDRWWRGSRRERWADWTRPTWHRQLLRHVNRRWSDPPALAPHLLLLLVSWWPIDALPFNLGLRELAKASIILFWQVNYHLENHLFLFTKQQVWWDNTGCSSFSSRNNSVAAPSGATMIIIQWRQRGHAAMILLT